MKKIIVPRLEVLKASNPKKPRIRFRQEPTPAWQSDTDTHALKLREHETRKLNYLTLEEAFNDIQR